VMRIYTCTVVVVSLLAAGCGCQTEKVEDELRADITRDFVKEIPSSAVLSDTVVVVAEIEGDQQNLLNEFLATAFTRDSRFVVAERQKEFLRACEKEKLFGKTDFVADSTAARLGRLHGAQLVAVGRIWSGSMAFVNREMAAQLKLLHAESGFVRHSMNRKDLRRDRTDWASVVAIVMAIVVLLLVIAGMVVVVGRYFRRPPTIWGKNKGTHG